ncbi:hypothetical protein A2U01_0065758, partial [Trifolium medium]|nr:hypothetical protein [Trifolium medium]
MGPEAIRGEIATHSMAVFKLLETVTFLNGHECKYLQERDAARKRVKDIGLQLSELHAAFDDYKNKYALQQKLVMDLEATETKLAEVVQERDTL